MAGKEHHEGLSWSSPCLRAWAKERDARWSSLWTGVREWTEWGRTGSKANWDTKACIRSLLLQMGPLRSIPGAPQNCLSKRYVPGTFIHSLLPPASWGLSLRVLTPLTFHHKLERAYWAGFCSSAQGSEAEIRKTQKIFWRLTFAGNCSLKLWLKLDGGLRGWDTGLRIFVLQIVLLTDSSWLTLMQSIKAVRNCYGLKLVCWNTNTQTNHIRRWGLLGGDYVMSVEPL